MNVSSVSGVSDKFDFAVDFRREELKLRDKIEYYFVVSDNDGVNGSKATSSDKWSYVLPTLEELSEIRNAEQTKVIDDLAALNKRAQDFQKNMEQLKKDVLNAKKSDWNKSNKLNQLKEEQKSLFGTLDGEALLKLLGDDLAKKIRKYDTGRVSKPSLVGREAQPKPSEGARRVPEKITKEDWKTRLERIKAGIE
jgi:chromosome segregation ATPase